MLDKLRSAGLVWPTLLMLPALALMLGLGSWQMQRKAWKDGLQAQIRERTALPPTPVQATATATHEPGSDLEYTRVIARGRLLHDLERHVYWPASGGPGWLVHTPLLLEGGRLVLLVNRGWVPDALKNAERRSEGRVPGIAEVVGLIRRPEAPGLFTPANTPERNIWFSRDIAAMLACNTAETNNAGCTALARGGTTGGPAQLWFLVDQEAEPAPPGGWPRGGTTNLTMPNRHLEYALTWFALAATLIGVWLSFALSRLKRPAAGPG